MKIAKLTRKKGNRKYRQRSLRFPVAFIFILLILLPVSGIYFVNGLFRTMAVIDVVIIFCGFLILLLMEWVESWYYPRKLSFFTRLLLLGIRIITIFAICWKDAVGVALPIIAMFFYTLYFYFGFFPTIFSLIGGLSFLMVNPTNLDLPMLDQSAWYYFIFMVLFSGLIKRDERNQSRNRELYRELEQYAAHSTSLAKQEERNRISRDLHDSLGHYLVAVNIQIQKATAFREINAAESDTALQQAQQATSDAIKELRNTLKDLREINDSFDFLADIQALVDGAQNNGRSVELTIQGNEAEYSDLILITLRQMVQEGLTNIKKHAKASQVELNIAFGRKQVRLSLIDDGVGFSPGAVDDKESFGLKGISERVDLVGGKMTIKSKENAGTKLTLYLPKKGYA